MNGLVLAAEKIDDGTAINLGTEEAIRLIDAARLILEYLLPDTHKIVGVLLTAS